MELESPRINAVWVTHDGTEKVIEDIFRKIEELDPSDDYHKGQTIDAESYYRAIDRCLGIINGELQDWRSQK